MDTYESPFAHFNAWFEHASDREVLPEAAHLATVDAAGRPAGRMVLVRRWSPRGFEVQTSVDSPKAAALRARPLAALTWYWPSLDRQVRVEGAVEWLTDEESDGYWRTRSRDSQLSALASEQSRPIASRDALFERRAEVERRYRGVDPLPRLGWAGFRVAPVRVEFFQDQPDRFQDRLEYRRASVDSPWGTRILQP